MPTSGDSAGTHQQAHAWPPSQRRAVAELLRKLLAQLCPDEVCFPAGPAPAPNLQANAPPPPPIAMPSPVPSTPPSPTLSTPSSPGSARHAPSLVVAAIATPGSDNGSTNLCTWDQSKVELDRIVAAAAASFDRMSTYSAVAYSVSSGHHGEDSSSSRESVGSWVEDSTASGWHGAGTSVPSGSQWSSLPSREAPHPRDAKTPSSESDTASVHRGSSRRRSSRHSKRGARSRSRGHSHSRSTRRHRRHRSHSRRHRHRHSRSRSECTQRAARGSGDASPRLDHETRAKPSGLSHHGATRASRRRRRRTGGTPKQQAPARFPRPTQYTSSFAPPVSIKRRRPGELASASPGLRQARERRFNAAQRKASTPSFASPGASSQETVPARDRRPHIADLPGAAAALSAWKARQMSLVGHGSRSVLGK